MRWLSIVIFLILGGWILGNWALGVGNTPNVGTSHVELKPIHLMTASGNITLMAEIADTPTMREKGLMWRQDLPQGEAMLFVFEDEKWRSFWMKNTPTSLDILFFDGQGAWLNSHHNTTPYSEQGLNSSAKAQYALEIIAGDAKRLGLGRGTVLKLEAGLSMKIK